MYQIVQAQFAQLLVGYRAVGVPAAGLVVGGGHHVEVGLSEADACGYAVGEGFVQQTRRKGVVGAGPAFTDVEELLEVVDALARLLQFVGGDVPAGYEIERGCGLVQKSSKALRRNLHQMRESRTAEKSSPSAVIWPRRASASSLLTRLEKSASYADERLWHAPLVLTARARAIVLRLRGS